MTYRARCDGRRPKKPDSGVPKRRPFSKVVGAAPFDALTPPWARQAWERGWLFNGEEWRLGEFAKMVAAGATRVAFEQGLRGCEDSRQLVAAVDALVDRASYLCRSFTREAIASMTNQRT